MPNLDYKIPIPTPIYIIQNSKYQTSQHHTPYHTILKMGQFITKLKNVLSGLGTQESKILMLGLDGAGKTSVLYKLKLNEYLQSVPTIGFNCEKVKYKNLEMLMWDIGGQTHIRKLWFHYFDSTDAIIFIVDSADEERIGLAKQELDALMEAEDLNNASLLVFANKMDISRMGVPKIAEQLGLHRIKRDW